MKQGWEFQGKVNANESYTFVFAVAALLKTACSNVIDALE